MQYESVQLHQGKQSTGWRCDRVITPAVCSSNHPSRGSYVLKTNTALVHKLVVDGELVVIPVR
jgi:hypothetical protein